MSLTPPPAPATEKHLTRTGIMLALLPTVNATLAAVPGLVLTDKDVLRRTFRALLTIGIRLMFDAGLPVEMVVGEVKNAIGAELKERADKAKEQGATQQPASA